MSQEQPPIRSRRELRRAREQHLEQTSQDQAAAEAASAADAASVQAAPGETAKTAGPETRRVRRVADTPVDAKPATERSSQIRARDRAALRAIKELADKEGQLAKGGPPTRRQLRLQQLQEELAPGTSNIPLVPPVAPAPPAAPISSVPGASPGGGAGSGTQSPGAPYRTAPDGAIRVTAGPPASGGGASPQPAEMSVEQALAARELLTAQARNQANKLEHIATLDADARPASAPAKAAADRETDEAAEDPQDLARQIAQAEREAILNKRAEAKQKLAEKAGRPAPAAATQAGSVKTGPATANNLAMVTPLEFVKVPGVDRPMMKPPATSFVPLVTSPGPKLGKEPDAAKQRSKRGRAAVLARAEAAAKAGRKRTAAGAVVDSEAVPPAAQPIAARAAYGLEPLDAATAGLARARRQQLLLLCLAVIAAAAVIAGIVFIAGGTGR
ncbi:hypothetical protein BIU82_00285 [Arthrobacter sp. SW1]|uniref:hypothetical protein n=1 Tax=Arthrobacter sp. SW1 TaxID=1920889 RepID=UPI000877D6BB|nr:hypothetical protein [Arthrobacter sp. SW1]OFI39554.1 hypothetical protein BIU82_00285 [Arthrobacter sp. SW1]